MMEDEGNSLLHDKLWEKYHTDALILVIGSHRAPASKILRNQGGSRFNRYPPGGGGWFPDLSGKRPNRAILSGRSHSGGASRQIEFCR